MAGLRDDAYGSSLPLSTQNLASSSVCPCGSWGSGWGFLLHASLSYPEFSFAAVEFGALACFVTSEQLPTEQKNLVVRRFLERQFPPHPPLPP